MVNKLKIAKFSIPFYNKFDYWSFYASVMFYIFVKIQKMKKLLLVFVVLAFIATVSSCRTSKYGCPSVSASGSSKALKA